MLNGCNTTLQHTAQISNLLTNVKLGSVTLSMQRRLPWGAEYEWTPSYALETPSLDALCLQGCAAYGKRAGNRKQQVS